MIQVKVKDIALREAAMQDMDAFIKVFVDATKEAIGGELNATTMQQLNVSQLVLLAYDILHEEVMDGGFVSSFTTVTEVSSLTIQWRRCCATGVCATLQSCSLPCASSTKGARTEGYNANAMMRNSWQCLNSIPNSTTKTTIS